MLRAKELRKMWTEDAKGTADHVTESAKKKEISLEDFSIRELAEELIPDGREYVRMMDPKNRSGVLEAAHAVDTAAFSHITGQLIFSTMMQSLELQNLIGDRLVTVMPSQFQEEELVPGISPNSDEYEQEITQGEDYPIVGLSENYITLPRAEKHGGILPITREAVIADRTGMLVEMARKVSQGLAIRREKTILDTFIGAVNPYSYKGEARITYHDTAMGFDNIATDGLLNYTDIEAVSQLFLRMRDPSTGEPLGHRPTTIVVAPQLEWVARRVIQTAGLVQTGVGHEVRAGGVVTQDISTVGGNLIPWGLEILTNDWLWNRLLAADGVSGLDTDGTKAAAFWFLGRPREAFVWKEIWATTVEEAGVNNEAQFVQDIWFRFKVGYKGAPGVVEPRLMIRSDGTA
jgi:hypothetical protein